MSAKHTKTGLREVTHFRRGLIDGVCAVALATAFSATPVMAQDTDAPAAEAESVFEIIVTSRKRSETTLDVPASVSVVTGETAQKLRVNDFGEYLELVPNVTLNTNGFTGKIDVQARGIGNPPNIASFDPSVAIYRNGFYISGGGIRGSQLVDIDRIEVLKGPQGGVYGRNAVTGVLDITFNTPDFDDPSLHVEAEYGRFERAEFWAAGNIPISDQFAVRVAGWYNDQNDSETQNAFRNEPLNPQNDYGVRGMATWRPTNNWESTLAVEYQESEFNTRVDTGTVTNSLIATLFAPFGTVPVDTVQTIDEVFLDRPNVNEDELFFISLNTTVDTDFGTITGLISYTEREGVAQRDQDFTADDPASAPGLVDSVNTVASEGEDLFIELRLDTPQDKPIRAQLGVSYLNQEQVQDGFQESFVDLPDAFETAPPAFGGAGLPMPLGVIDVGGIFAFDQEVESIAGYVDLEADITEDLTAGFAVRHTSDDKSGVQRQGLEGNPILVGLFASALPTLETALEETFNETSFSGDLNYNLNDTSSVYFRAATGFRAGGLNEIASSPDLLAYDPETTISYELGFKSFAAGGALGFNASIYHQTLDDALLFVGDPGNPAAGIAVNAGETRAIGVEAEVSWRPSDFVTVFASGSYVDAEITEISATAASLGGVVGNRPTRAPKWTAAAALIAEKPISDDVTALFSTNLSYLSDSFDDVANTENLGELFTLDLTAGFEYKNYSLVGFVDNLTEDRNFQQISNISNPTIGTLFRQSEPRTYGVRLVADF